MLPLGENAGDGNIMNDLSDAFRPSRRSFLPYSLVLPSTYCKQALCRTQFLTHLYLLAFQILHALKPTVTAQVA